MKSLSQALGIILGTMEEKTEGKACQRNVVELVMKRNEPFFFSGILLMPDWQVHANIPLSSLIGQKDRQDFFSGRYGKTRPAFASYQ